MSCWTFTNILLKYRDDRGKPVSPSQAFTHVPFSESTSRMTDVVFSEKGKVSRAVLGQEWSHSWDVLACWSLTGWPCGAGAGSGYQEVDRGIEVERRQGRGVQRKK